VANVDRLEELGRKVMAASVEAEYLHLVNVISYLDAAFLEVVRLVLDQQHEIASEERRERRVAEDAALVEMDKGG